MKLCQGSDLQLDGAKTISEFLGVCGSLYNMLISNHQSVQSLSINRAGNLNGATTTMNGEVGPVSTMSRPNNNFYSIVGRLWTLRQQVHFKNSWLYIQAKLLSAIQWSLHSRPNGQRPAQRVKPCRALGQWTDKVETRVNNLELWSLRSEKQLIIYFSCRSLESLSSREELSLCNN